MCSFNCWSISCSFRYPTCEAPKIVCTYVSKNHALKTRHKTNIKTTIVMATHLLQILNEGIGNKSIIYGQKTTKIVVKMQNIIILSYAVTEWVKRPFVVLVDIRLTTKLFVHKETFFRTQGFSVVQYLYTSNIVDYFRISRSLMFQILKINNLMPY